MIERKPPRMAAYSEDALTRGADLYQIFRKLVSLDAPLAADVVSVIARETGLGERRIRELARRYRSKPIAESLASRPRGPKPGSRQAPPEVLVAIDGLIEEIVLTKVPLSVREAAQQVRYLLIADNGDYGFDPGIVPSFRTIERIIGEISEPQKARFMGSKRRTAHEAHPGEYHSDGLLDVVQMDHTPADVILVDSTHRMALGRPWVTLLIDVWSRCILGFYVSFGAPSIFRCGRAIANALLPKQPLLESLGLEIEYPMHGFFRKLHADHVGSHRAEVFRSACKTYGIDPDVRPRGPAHYGTHIERLIGTMTRRMRLLPGATGGNVTARDGHDAEADAAMTLEEFERWLVREICRYHHTPHEGLGRVAPAQMWSTGVESHGPLAPPGVDIEQLTRRFLPWVERTVQSGGVKIDHIRYWHESLAPRLGLKVMIHYDDRTIQEVYPVIDGVLVAAAAVGNYPNVTRPEWDVAVAARRHSGVVYQHAGGQAEIARLVHANRQEVLNAKSRTRGLRDARKRLEREGVSHAAQPANQEVSNVPSWVSVADLHDEGWLKWRD